MSYLPLQALQAHLQANGLDVRGVTVGHPPDIVPFVNGWNSTPNAVQKEQASLLCSLYDMRPRQSRTIEAITTSINALAATDKVLLANAANTHLNASTNPLARALKELLVLPLITPGYDQRLLLAYAAGLIWERPWFCTGLGMVAPVWGDEVA